MKRLSLEELKALKAENIKESLESINGGSMDIFHFLNEVFKIMASSI